MSRIDEIRLSRYHDDSPEIRKKLADAGITYASPTFLKGTVPIELCIFDDSKLVLLTRDGLHRRCSRCPRTYHFTGVPLEEKN